ncbi:MAG: adenine deaminase, partial [Solobacterium sp.]|nr:adenine deaminase [Solobacterium sp.]
MERLGAIAPGYAADINVVPDLKELWPSQVYFEGKKVAEDRKLLVKITEKHYEIEDINTMNLPDLTVEDFILKPPVENGHVKINYMHYPTHDSALTELKQMYIEVKDGKFILPHDDMKYVAVINRFGKKHIALAFVEGIGLMEGTMAATVSHDSHNLTIVYDTPKNALIAANALKECGGGLCSVAEGEVLGLLPLPIGGLLSKAGAEETSVLADKLKEVDRKLGLTEIPNPLLRIAVLALPVIPFVKMSDMGMIEVTTKTFVPVFPE